MTSNFEAALKAETKKVVRCFHRHSSETRSNLQSSRRLTPGQRESVGEFFYMHPDLPGVCFPKRGLAAKAALRAQDMR